MRFHPAIPPQLTKSEGTQKKPARNMINIHPAISAAFCLMVLGCSVDDSSSKQERGGLASDESKKGRIYEYKFLDFHIPGNRETAKLDGLNNCSQLKNDAYRCQFGNAYSLFGVPVGIPYVVMRESEKYHYDAVRFDFPVRKLPDRTLSQPLGRPAFDTCDRQILSAVKSGVFLDSEEYAKAYKCKDYTKKADLLRDELKKDDWVEFSSNKESRHWFTGECKCSEASESMTVGNIYSPKVSSGGCYFFFKKGTPVRIDVAYRVESIDPHHAASVWNQRRLGFATDKEVAAVSVPPNLHASVCLSSVTIDDANMYYQAYAKNEERQHDLQVAEAKKQRAAHAFIESMRK